jgi:hypothetical protein
VRKNKAPFYTEKPPRTLNVWLALRLIVATAALGPFLYEGTLILYGRWMKVLGYRTVVRTPVLDNLGLLARSARGSLMTQFHRVPWNPQAVIVVGVLSCAVCMFLLRGRGSRVE